MEYSRRLALILLTAVLLLFLCAIGVVRGWQMFYAGETPSLTDLMGQAETPEPTETPGPPALSPTTMVAAPSPPTLPAPTTTPLPATVSTAQQLLNAELLARDQRLLAMRLTQHGIDIPQVVRNAPIAYQTGIQDTFWVTDNSQQPPRQFQSQATLQHISDHAYWWVADGFSAATADIQTSAELFDQTTYPTSRAFFGTEWQPGVDSDPRVHIFMGDVPGVAGYFAASNSYSSLAELYSNEREMFFINLSVLKPGTTQFDSVLAHEFQHMIHWHQDRNEDTWVNEGFSEYAAFLNGFGESDFLYTFLNEPDSQLTSWATTLGNSTVHYGSSFLFVAYVGDHYGEDLLKAVVAHPSNGAQGFSEVLQAQGIDCTFDDLFADFVVANYINNPALVEGQWGYTHLSFRLPRIAAEYANYPVDSVGEVSQYGADYIVLSHNAPLTVDFAGDPTVAVLPTEPHSGDYFWYSHRGDDINTRLTRDFDLSGVDSATLSYWVWFDIEPQWDYGYVELSSDGGQTWQALATSRTSPHNPTGNAYGPGYTGLSNGWVNEQIDLTAYVGQPIQLRFEYVTDDAVNHPGWAIDDLSIPEIGFSDDMESDDNGWQAEGFVRIDNELEQKFVVQLIELGRATTVQKMELNAQNQGRFVIDSLGGETTEAILIISGLTPVTTERAAYRYQVRP